MNSQPFDREHQKSQLNAYRNHLDKQGNHVCWIEGPSGVGKTTLLNYATELCLPYLLTYATGEVVVKCQEAHIRHDFHYISHILGSLQNKYPREFNALTSQYFSRLEHAPLLESLVAIIPAVRGFKWVERLVARRSKAIERSRTHVHEHLITLQLTQVYTTLIAELLMSHHVDKTPTLVIAIDDICWIDQQSLQILKQVSLQLRANAISIHYLLASRSYHAVEDTSHYALVEESFKGIATSFTSVPVHHFDRSLTRGFVASSRADLSVVADNIYDITKGNLQELCQVLKMSPNDIQDLGNEKATEQAKQPDGSTDLENFYASIHRIKDTLSRAPINLHVLVAVVALGNELTRNECTFLVRALARNAGQQEPTQDEMSQALADLSAPDAHVLSISPSSIRLSHDSTSTLLTSILERSGVLSKLNSEIIDVLCEDRLSRQVFGWPSALMRALELCLSSDATGGLQIFAIQYESARKYAHYRKGLAELGSAIAVGLPLERLLANLPQLLRCFSDLVDLGSYAHAAELGEKLFSSISAQPVDIAFAFLLKLAIALRETDRFEGAAPTARDAIEAARDLEQVSDLQRIRANTVYCSILEHYHEHQHLRDIYAENTALFDTCSAGHPRMIEHLRHVRNLGLVQDHEDSIPEYEGAETLSRQLDVDDVGEQLVRASVLNSLGLGLLRSGSAQSALDHFSTCIELMSSAYYPAETPLNNSAVCQAMLGNWYRALDYANSARAQVTNSPYRELSIDINLSVIYWKTGREEMALSLARQIVGLEPSGRRSFNPELRVRSSMNLGFFLLQQGLFDEAAEAYRMSMSVDIRLAADQERARRGEMMRYCQARAGSVAGEELDTLSAVDLFETAQSPVRKAYDMQLLALYFS